MLFSGCYGKKNRIESQQFTVCDKAWSKINSFCPLQSVQRERKDKLLKLPIQNKTFAVVAKP